MNVSINILNFFLMQALELLLDNLSFCILIRIHADLLNQHSLPISIYLSIYLTLYLSIQLSISLSNSLSLAIPELFVSCGGIGILED